MNIRPRGASQVRVRVSSARQLAMCSNISTETMRSNRSSVSKTFMSRVSTVTLVRPRSRARASMYWRWGTELETAVMRAFG